MEKYEFVLALKYAYYRYIFVVEYFICHLPSKAIAVLTIHNKYPMDNPYQSVPKIQTFLIHTYYSGNLSHDRTS